IAGWQYVNADRARVSEAAQRVRADKAARDANDARASAVQAANEAIEQRNQAEAAQKTAEAAQRAALDSRAEILLAQADQQVRAADFTGALGSLNAILKSDPKFGRTNRLFPTFRNRLFSVAIKKPAVAVIKGPPPPNDDNQLTEECVTTDNLGTEELF